MNDITQFDPEDRKPDVFSSGQQKTQALDYLTSTVKPEVLKNTRGYSPAFSEVLRGNRTVSSDTLSVAMDMAQQWQAPLGDVLIAQGEHVSRSIYGDFSQSLQLPLLDISNLDTTPEIVTEQQLDYLLQNQLVLLQDDPSPLYASASLDLPQDPATRRQSFSLGNFSAIITARDHRSFFLNRYGRTLCARATIKLARWAPEFSARIRMSWAQTFVLMLVCALFASSAFYWPNGTFTAVNIFFSLWFSALIALRAAALAYAPFHERASQNNAAAPPMAADLPIYTILVPLYREAAVLGQLSKAMKALQYPAAKLDIKLLLEEDDQVTIDAAKALNLPDNFEIVIVPHALPKTKPKALNLGLQFARGEYVVVYDAEDIPHPGQLLEALAAFSSGPENLACIQARLNFYNPDDNWLTRQFTVEYSVLFDLILPFIERLDIPIPLGGTSNHFKTSVLRKLGAWDPHNVTEDADLGIRLSRLGFTSDIITSTTREEAVGEMRGWIKQRSRWLKGWMQTYLVHMRRPAQLYKDLGARGFFGFQIIFGGILVAALLHPFFIVWASYALVVQFTVGNNAWFGGLTLQVANFFIFFAGYFFSMLAGAYALEKRGLHGLVATVFFMPIYWLLVSVGAYLGLWQLIFKPFYWEKTNHGRRVSVKEKHGEKHLERPSTI